MHCLKRAVKERYVFLVRQKKNSVCVTVTVLTDMPVVLLTQNKVGENC